MVVKSDVMEALRDIFYCCGGGGALHCVFVAVFVVVPPVFGMDYEQRKKDTFIRKKQKSLLLGFSLLQADNLITHSFFTLLNFRVLFFFRRSPHEGFLFQ